MSLLFFNFIFLNIPKEKNHHKMNIKKTYIYTNATILYIFIAAGSELVSSSVTDLNADGSGSAIPSTPCKSNILMV